MSNDGYINCPYCDVKIKVIAVKCRYCHPTIDEGKAAELESIKL